MSPPTSFHRFSDLPFELREPIWLLSLDELARSWKPQAPSRLLHPLKQRHWLPRNAMGAGPAPAYSWEEAKERQLPLYQTRERIPHFQVSRDARAAASRWVQKQEAGWLAAHQGCDDPRRCATSFDGDRKALVRPRPLNVKKDGLFLSQQEYERCCDRLGRRRGGEYQPGVNWKLNQLWERRTCEQVEDHSVFGPQLVVPLSLLRWDPNALENIALWDGNTLRDYGLSDFKIMVVTVIVNELPHLGDRMTVQEAWTFEYLNPEWTSWFWPWRADSSMETVDSEVCRVIKSALATLEPDNPVRCQIQTVRVARAVRQHGKSTDVW